VSFGTVSRRTSSVMVATATMILSSRADLASRESDTGGRLIRLMNKRRRTTALKGAEVRPRKGGALTWRAYRIMEGREDGGGAYGLGIGRV
jgi:hypothetical protein